MKDKRTTHVERLQIISDRRKEHIAMISKIDDEVYAQCAAKALQDKLVYVVERNDVLIAHTSIEGVWKARLSAWEHVMEALADEKLRIETEESVSGNPADTTEKLTIQESSTNASSTQRYYVLTDEDGYEFLGFYITEVEIHE